MVCACLKAEYIAGNIKVVDLPLAIAEVLTAPHDTQRDLKEKVSGVAFAVDRSCATIPYGARHRQP